VPHFFIRGKENMLSYVLICLLACNNKLADTGAADIVERESPIVEDTLPEDQPWGYEPDMVLFHSVTVVTNENEVSCYDDGDGSPYCGVQKIILTVWDEYDGLTDEGNCMITHRVTPEFLVVDGGANLLDNGAVAAWELDATQSLVGTSTMCDFIREGTPYYSVLNRFKTQNLVWGLTTPSQDMLDELQEVYEYTNEDMEELTPKLGAYMNMIGNEYRIPNFTARYEIDENNTPVTDGEGVMNSVTIGGETLENGYYRSPPFYVYSLEKFVTGE
jgi:hypothetical protein